MTITAQRTPILYRDYTLSSGQTARVCVPNSALRGTSTPVVYWSHPQGQTEQFVKNYFVWPLAQAVLNAGMIFAASSNHGANSWGSTPAQQDLADLDTFLAAHYTLGKRILGGGSMGGTALLNALAAGVVPNVSGIFGIDAVCSLSSLYSNAAYTAGIGGTYSVTAGTLSSAMATTGLTSVPTTASFPTVGTVLRLGNGTANVEDVTTTGASTGTAVAVTATTKTHASADQVSDYPAKTSGFDPLTKAAAAFPSVRQRFYASPNDTTVLKTVNADAFNTLMAARAVETAVVAHAGVHLAGSGVQPNDIVPFLLRCAA